MTKDQYNTLTEIKDENCSLISIRVLNAMNICNNENGILHRICKVRKPEVLSTIFVKTILLYKWKSFGKRQYYI
jgi:hypothetical protein